MSRAQAGRTAKIAAVDDSYVRRQQTGEVAYPYERSQADILFDERSMRAQLRRERSAAYWFAASKWGMLGLIAGMILGGSGMYVASIAAIPMAQDAMMRAAAINDARSGSTTPQSATDFSLPSEQSPTP